MRVLPGLGHFPVGLDIKASPFTGVQGSVADPGAVAHAMEGAEGVIHTATLHKPHVATHQRQAFVDTNISGSLTVFEAAAELKRSTGSRNRISPVWRPVRASISTGGRAAVPYAMSV